MARRARVVAEETALQVVSSAPMELSVERARDILAGCTGVEDAPEAKRVHDTAEHALLLFRNARAGRESQNAAIEIIVRSERKLGALVAGIVPSPGRRKKGGNVATFSRKEFLASLDATQRDGARWMKLHEVDESDFEDYLAAVKAKGEKLTLSELRAGRGGGNARSWDPDVFIRSAEEMLRVWFEEWRRHETSNRLLSRLRSSISLEAKHDE